MTMFTRNDKESDTAAAAKSLDAKPAAAHSPVEDIEHRRTTASSSPHSPMQGSAPSVISRALKITGQLESSEDIQIDGNVEGDIRAMSVKVGCGAVVKGSVYGEAVELSGSVNGKIEAKKVVLTETARMSGDIIHQDIQINSGAYVDGHCRPEFGKTADNKLHPLHAAASAREKEASKKASNGRTKAELGSS